MTMKRIDPILRRAAAVAVVLAAAATPPAAALHSVFVAVPSYSEEALTWCGPAAAQMVMAGYPTAPCSHLQADVWAEILLHKTEPAWDADPAGMRGAMLALCPVPGTWAIYHRPAADELMFSVAYWMTRNNFPVAAVLDTTAHRPPVPAHQEHWVVIKGIVTDVDPTVPGTTAVNLEHIWYTDPAPAVFGDPAIEHFVAGGDWYLDFQAVGKAASAYLGEYVALIEPPRLRGRAVARKPLLRGELIPLEAALERAKRWVEEMRLLRELKPFADLARARPGRPLLVDPDGGGYYLVPFTVEGETVRHAVLINAYSGDFKELGAFAPVRYLEEREAVKRAKRLLRPGEEERVKASLVYDPEAGAVSRFHPVWRIQSERGVVAVRQDGTVRRWPAKRERQPD